MLLLANGKENQRARKEMLLLFLRYDAEEVRQQIRGFERISSQEVLLSYLCQLEKEKANKTWLQLASAEASKEELRVLQCDHIPARASHRPEYSEQSTLEYSDFMQSLPQLLARHAEKAWVDYCRENAVPYGWEEGIARVANGVPGRVDRLKALGNAVVPQISEIIGRAIVKIEDRT